MAIIAILAMILCINNVAFADDAEWTELSDTQECGHYTVINNFVVMEFGEQLTTKLSETVNDEMKWKTDLSDFGMTIANEIKKAPGVGSIRINPFNVLVGPVPYPKDFDINTVLDDILMGARLIACKAAPDKLKE